VGAVVKRATLADVAARSGMSKTAVSLVLNDRPGSRISDDAVRRIREAARELNYRPNPAARSLRVGKTNTIGFISDDVTVTRFASAMIRGMLDVADERDNGVLIAETGSHPLQLEKALDFMVDRQVDGIIVGAMSARALDLPKLPGGLRVVTANCTSPAARYAVLPEEREAGYAMARQLLDAGHKAIAIVGNAPIARTNPRVSVTIGDRFEGIQQALSEAGVGPVAVVDFEVWEIGNGYAGTVELLDRNPPVTALICMNDRVAFGAYQAMQERKLRVPEDISVASFDDDDVIAPHLRPGLTTARLQYEVMGRLAMELMLDPDAPEGVRRVPMPVQVRGSVGPRATAAKAETVTPR
jgi:LacI family transcriptional regulator